MRTIVVEIDGRAVKGFAEEIGGALWAHANGMTFVYEPPKKASRRRGAGAGADPGRVAAPMPGKIVKAHVRPGEAVAPGQALVTLEAMKMEYAIKAQAPGLVREVLCAAGDQVALGQALVLLEETAERA
jgi:biotin carboxyl carrier protein